LRPRAAEADCRTCSPEIHPNSNARWELEPDGAGCVLTLTQDGLPFCDATDNGGGCQTYAAADGVRTLWSALREAVDAQRYPAALATL
jgi:hypothetical protein